MQKIMSQKEAYFYNFYGICIGTYLKCQIDVDHKRKNKDLLSTHNRKSHPTVHSSSREKYLSHTCAFKKILLFMQPWREQKGAMGGRISGIARECSEHGSRGTRAGREA